MTPAASAAPAPSADAPDSSAPAPRRGHGQGTWRSLTLCMIVLLAFLLLWQALTLRPARVALPAVDARAKAVQVATDTRWTVVLPQVGAPWRATAATMEPVRGAATFTAGYHKSPDDTEYVAISQGIPDAAAASTWVAELSRNGQPQGSIDIDGTAWRRLTSPGDPVRNALVREGNAKTPTLVIAGNVSFEDLATFAKTLKVIPGR